MNKIILVLRLDEFLYSVFVQLYLISPKQVYFSKSLFCILQHGLTYSLLMYLEHVFLKSKTCLSWIKGTNPVASAEICSQGLMFPVVYTECSAGIAGLSLSSLNAPSLISAFYSVTELFDTWCLKEATALSSFLCSSLDSFLYLGCH